MGDAAGAPPDAPFSALTRREFFAAAGREEFDILVVGGGITGAAIAHRAARRGLRVALVEKGDFASGTSSRSSRLIHGGLRYLQHGHLRLVFHSLREQVYLAQSAPHLVRPQRFLIPFYRGAPLPPWMIQTLMSIYHSLHPLQGRLGYRHLTPRAVLEEEGALRPDGLRGALAYHEFSTHDARLVLETVLAARAAGAVTLNYAGLLNFLVRRGRVSGGILQDQLTGETKEVQARVVVNAAGPWSDLLAQSLAPRRRRLRMSKGVHIVIPHRRLPLAGGVNLFSPRDGRAFMARPAGDLVFVGPTETEYAGDPAAAAPDPADRDYLLETVAAYFPDAAITIADVIGMTAGLRPLYDRPARAAGEVSRAYEVVWGPEGLLSVLGGKLTLHRRAAATAVRFLEQQCGWPAGFPNGEATLPGAAWARAPGDLTGAFHRAGVDAESAAHLLRTYGARSARFLEVLRASPEWRARVLPDLPHIWAECAFAQEWEMAIQADDFLHRRGDLALLAAAHGRALPPAVQAAWGRTPVPVGPST